MGFSRGCDGERGVKRRIRPSWTDWTILLGRNDTGM
jgi:hypothetical protein